MPVDLSLLLPEVLVTVLALVLLCADGWIADKRQLGRIALFGLVAVCGATIGMLAGGTGVGTTLAGMFVGDRLGLLLRFAISGSAALVVALSLDPVSDKPHAGEFYSLLMFAVLGAMLAVSAGDLVEVFVSIELLSLSSYVLTGWLKTDRRGSEAALKYLLFGGTSSGVFLFGTALLYGITGTTNLAGIDQALSHLDPGFGPLVLFAGLLAIAGLAYKVSAVPFHAWCPDVYEGAPVPVVAFLSVGSKIAGFAVLIRLLTGALPSLAQDWTGVVAILSVGSMTLGNWVALSQTNVKRMLGYSSIAQAGYLLLGLVAASSQATQGQGLAAIVFYLVSYAFMTVGAFAIVAMYAHLTGREAIADYAGLARRNPLMALFMLVCMVSLAGLPPLVGFWGKFYLFSAVVQFAVASGQRAYLGLAVIGVLNSVVSMYYYMKIPKAMYLDSSEDAPLATPGALAAVAFVGAVGALALFVFPQPIWDLALSAVKGF